MNVSCPFHDVTTNIQAAVMLRNAEATAKKIILIQSMSEMSHRSTFKRHSCQLFLDNVRIRSTEFLEIPENVTKGQRLHDLPIVVSHVTEINKSKQNKEKHNKSQIAFLNVCAFFLPLPFTCNHLDSH